MIKADMPSWMNVDDAYGDDVSSVSTYSFYKDAPDGEVVLFYDDVPHCYYRYDSLGNRIDIPGVTTVVNIIDKSHALMRWAVKLAVETIRIGLEDGTKLLPTEEFNMLLKDATTKHTQELEEAGSVGHTVHAILEEMVVWAILTNGGILRPYHKELPEDDRVHNCIRAALEWADAHNVRFLFTERKVYSRLFDTAGTGDGLALVSSCDDSTCCKSYYKDALDFIDWKTSKSMRTSYRLQTAIYQFAYVEETGEKVTGRWILKLDKETAKLSKLYCGPETFEDDVNCYLACLDLYRRWKAIEENERKDKQETKEIKKLAKAAQKAQDKLTKAKAKEGASRAKKVAQDAKKALYKQLRAGGKSVTEARFMAGIDPPKEGKTWVLDQLAKEAQEGGYYDVVPLEPEQQDVHNNTQGENE